MTSKELGIMMQAARLMAKAAYDKLNDEGRAEDSAKELLANAMMIVQLLPKEKLQEALESKGLDSFPIPDISLMADWIKTGEPIEPLKRKRGRPPKPKP